MKQAHSASIWSEPSGSGGTPTITPMKFIADGADYAISASGTEIAQLVDGGSGSALFSTNMGLTPTLHMVMSKGDIVLY